MRKQERLAIVSEVIEILKKQTEKEALNYLITKKEFASSTAYGYIMIAKEKIRSEN